MPDGLIEELTAADDEFGRPAVPSVYAEYVVFMATGAYPYTADVMAFIVRRHGVPEGLQRKLSHEVYLSSGQWGLSEMVAAHRALTEQGYQPITELEPRAGARITLAGADEPYRLAAADHGDWALLAPRKRARGISLNGLLRAHLAFEGAVSLGQVRMDGPRVVMFKFTKEKTA